MDTLSFQSNNTSDSLESTTFTPLTAAALYLQQQQHSSLSLSLSLSSSTSTSSDNFTAKCLSFQKDNILLSSSLPPLTTGCSNLDQLFGNYGIPRIGITELVGEAGSGKTTFGFQLCIQAVLHGGSAIYINCEGTSLLAVERMIDIAVAELRKQYIALQQQEQQQLNHDNNNNDPTIINSRPPSSTITVPNENSLRKEAQQCLEYIHIISPTDRDDLSVKLNLCQSLLKQNNTSTNITAINTTASKIPSVLLASSMVRPIRVLILDSIGSVYRFIDTTNNNTTTTSSTDPDIMMDRSRGIFSLASLLKLFNSLYSVPIIVMNQITDILDNRLPTIPNNISINNLYVQKSSNSNNNNDQLSLGKDTVAISPYTVSIMHTLSAIPTNGRWIRPALGLTWDNCITVRVFLTHERQCIVPLYSTPTTNTITINSTISPTTTTNLMMDIDDIPFLSSTSIPPVAIVSPTMTTARYMLIFNSPYQGVYICPITLTEYGIFGIQQPERIRWL